MVGLVPWQAFVFGTIGIGLAASSAAAINHVLDAREDAKMARTSNRPLPQGEINERNALLFAGVLGIVAMLMLVYLVNVRTAVLTLLSLVGYAVVYTMYLKKATPQNIVIGGFTIPGWSNLFDNARLVNDGTIAVAAALILFCIPSRNRQQFNRVADSDTINNLPWNIVLLFGGGFALARGFTESGLSG